MLSYTSLLHLFAKNTSGIRLFILIYYLYRLFYLIKFMDYLLSSLRLFDTSKEELYNTNFLLEITIYHQMTLKIIKTYNI